MSYANNCKHLSVRHAHEHIMMHMIANPTQSLKEVALLYGYTAQSLYLLVHNDLFQARFNELKKEHFSEAAVGITEKLEALGQMALDRWGEMIETSADPTFIKSSADKILQRLGYGATNSAAIRVTVGSDPSPHLASRVAIEAANRARLRLQEMNKANALEVEFHEIKNN
jgi:hypothetical protein